MKMPPTVEDTTDNGIYEYEESSLSIASEEIENTNVEDFDAPPENDFSEYMWMENEEEFDKEVMQRLEEEALMEECIAYMSTENGSYQNSSEGSGDSIEVTTSKLNPEAAEFVPSNRREPPLEEIPVTSTSP
ncbi:polyadenylate-binding protein-interacting protein 2B [Euwallacea fornicatus]|uniref:polyadenylate-binding protein-interacting protein 2B n=1 Tax=Euwallacea fornicatus TaxID=995702 RepID=UPI00338FBD3B